MLHKYENTQNNDPDGYVTVLTSTVIYSAIFVSLVLAHTKQVSVVIMGLSTPGG